MHIPGQVGLDAMPKIAHFLWLCHHNSVPVREVIAARGVQCDTTCSLCRNGTESISHLLRVPFCCRILEEDRGARLFDFLLQLKLVGLVEEEQHVQCPNQISWNSLEELIPFCCLGVMDT